MHHVALVGVQDLGVVTQQLVAERGPGLVRHGLARGGLQCGVAGVVEDPPRGVVKLLLEGVHLEQQAVVAVGDQVDGPAGARADGGHAGGLRLLDGLAERLKLAGVHEQVQRGVRAGELLAGQRPGEHGGRQGLRKAIPLRAVADDDELDRRVADKRGEAVHRLLRGQPAHEAHDLLRPRGVPHAAQHVGALVRVEQFGVHAAAPVAHVVDAVGFEHADIA